MTSIGIIASLIGVLIIGFGLAISHHLSDPQWLILLFIAWVFLLTGSRLRLPSKAQPFNRSLIRTALTLFTVFIVISAQLVRIQVVEQHATTVRTATSADGDTLGNPRLVSEFLAQHRGDILDRNGHIIAGTERDGEIYRRYWPDPATAALAGYYSPLLYGATGLESAYNDVLSGQSGNNPITRFINNLLHRPQQGSDLMLTIDADLQQSALDLLGGRAGSVVVMDVQTGAVIVMASNPTYDPNRLFTTSSTAERDAAIAYWQSLGDAGNDPLVQRATMGLYTPGSTFKTITVAVGLELGIIQPDDIFADDGVLDIDGRLLVENNRPDDSRTQWTVTEALAWSLNVVFAQIGLQIGGHHLWDMVQKFGIADEIPFDLPVATGQLASSRDALVDQNLLADTAFGQGEILVTPLFMCMVAATFANGGSMMTPYLVDSIVDPSGHTVEQTHPRSWRHPISEATADTVQDLMIYAVEHGAVSGAALAGYLVGGKTGTAETVDGAVNQWFIGFIGDDAPRYAVAVVLEHTPSGLGGAVEIGREILLATIRTLPSGA